MALILRNAPNAKKKLSRLLDGREGKARQNTRKEAPGGKQKRWAKPAGKKFSVSWKGMGRFFNWLGTIGLMAALLGFISVGLLYGYRYVTTSSYFAVKNLEVMGNFRLSSREVLDMVGLYPGMNALLVSLDTVERKLGENDWIEKVSVKRIFPDGFAIRIKEKEPRFWLRRDGILYYADAVGHLITEVSPGRFASLPTLEIEPGAEDMANRLPELMASLAKVRFAIGAAGISRVRISPARSVEIFLAKTRVALFIGEESWSENLLRLAVVLEDMARRGEIKDVEEVRVHGSGVWVRKRIPAA